VKLSGPVTDRDQLAGVEDRQRGLTKHQRDSLAAGRADHHRLGEDHRELGRHLQRLRASHLLLGSREPPVEPLHRAGEHLGLEGEVPLLLAGDELCVYGELLRAAGR
jgi:hypothetical protein